MIVLDGSHGEGGGQILRTAFVLSMLTDQPFHIENIRSGRPNPGLKPQHLHIGKALLEMSEARIEGLTLGSQTLTFYPGTIYGGVYGMEIGTAGAIPLFLQTIVPVAMLANSSVTFTVSGGTDVRGAMTINFLSDVILPFIKPYAQRLELQINSHGFFPVGGGVVKLRVASRFEQGNWTTMAGQLPPLAVTERGSLKRVRVFSRASEDLSERKVAERQSTSFKRESKAERLEVKNIVVDSPSPGSTLTAVAEFEKTRLGADSLGERNKPAEEVGKEAAQRLNEELIASCTVDLHTADNLMLWVALFGGGYSFRQLTGHIATNAWTIEQFLPGALRLEENQVVGRSPA